MLFVSIVIQDLRLSKNGTKHLHVHLDRCIKRKNVDIKQQLLEVERKGCGTSMDEDGESLML